MNRQELIKHLALVGLDEFDQEDVEITIDVLLEAFTPVEIITWLFFYDAVMNGTPTVLLEQGRARDVRLRAQAMVREKSTT